MNYDTLDEDVVRLARAVRQNESSGGTNLVSPETIANKTRGPFQYKDDTFNTQAKLLGGKDLNGNPLDINNPEHQNLVFYTWAKKKKDEGYGVDQIAAAHNAGEGLLTGWENHKGVNEKGYAYDTPGYVNKVVSAYYKDKYGTESIPPGVQGGAQSAAITGNASSVPAFSPENVQQAQDEAKSMLGKVGGGIADIGRSILKAGVIRPGVRAGQALGQLGVSLFGNEEMKKRASEIAQKDISVPTGIGNTNVEGLGGITEGKTQQKIAGNALESASLLTPAGRFVKFGGKIVQPALEGALYGGTGGAGSAMSEGANASEVLARGALGTAFGGFFGGAGGALSKTAAKGKISPQLQQEASEGVKKELSTLESQNSKIRKVIQKHAARGVDVKDILSKTNLLHNRIDSDGVIRTTGEGGPIDELTSFIKPKENVVREAIKNEGATVPLAELQQKLTNMIDNSGLEGAALDQAHNKVEAAMRGYQRRANPDGTINLEKVHDAKVSAYSTIDYANPASKKADKAIARGLKEIIENKASTDVKQLNKELAQHYATLDFLEKLDGARVKGGRMGKYFATLSGNIIGSHFGPLGTVLGGEVASKAQSKMMQGRFSKAGNLPGLSTTTDSPAMKEAMIKNLMAEKKREMQGIVKGPQSKSESNLNQMYSNNNPSNKNGIDETSVSQIPGYQSIPDDIKPYYVKAHQQKDKFLEEVPQNIKGIPGLSLMNQEKARQVVVKTPESIISKLNRKPGAVPTDLLRTTVMVDKGNRITPQYIDKIVANFKKNGYEVYKNDIDNLWANKEPGYKHLAIKFTKTGQPDDVIKEVLFITPKMF